MKYLDDLGKPVVCYFYRDQDSWQYGRSDKKMDVKYSKDLLKVLMKMQMLEGYKAISVVRRDGVQMFELVGELGSSALFANVEADEPYKNALGFMKSLSSRILEIYNKSCYKEEDVVSFFLEVGNENEVSVINMKVSGLGYIMLRISDGFILSINSKDSVKINNEDTYGMKKDIVDLFNCIGNFKYSCTSVGYSRNEDVTSMDVEYKGLMGNTECFNVTNRGEVIHKVKVGIQSRR